MGGFALSLKKARVVIISTLLGESLRSLCLSGEYFSSF